MSTRACRQRLANAEDITENSRAFTASSLLTTIFEHTEIDVQYQLYPLDGSYLFPTITKG